MRKTIKRIRTLTIALAAALAIAAALGAQPAAADNPYASYGTTRLDYYDTEHWCTTPLSKGTQYAHGAWGWYVDGCTTRLHTCLKKYGCDITYRSEFSASPYEGIYRTTTNVRVRVWYSDGRFAGATDDSCDEPEGFCRAAWGFRIAYGQSATVQCNGVYGFYIGYRNASNLGARNRCSLLAPHQ